MGSIPIHPRLNDVDLNEGYFNRILESYTVQVSKDLIEKVNQARKYREWVAHGRRATDQLGNVTLKLVTTGSGRP
ncbi:MAG: hypothetical protein JWO38_7225 [Gemmataceae bacterium]|nr:hypothetical protein [Gemmataceae bacterium]